MDICYEILRSLGATLVHSLWQGALIALLVLSISAILPKSNASYRYVLMFSGLMLQLGLFVATFFYQFTHPVHLPVNNGQTLILLQAAASEYVNMPSYGAEAWFTKFLSFLTPYYPLLALAWFAGFLFTGIRMAGGLLVSRLYLRPTLNCPDSHLQHLFTRCYEFLKIPVDTTLRITSRMVSPQVIGFLKPVVIIPAAIITGLTTEQLEAVIAHELAHIKRFDHIMIVFQAIASQVLFFHPLTWFLSAEIDRERENCCDDLVVQMNTNPITYIKALAMIQEMNVQHVVPANALIRKPNQLLKRINRMISPEVRRSTSSRLTITLLLLAAIGASAMTVVLTGKPGNLTNNAKDPQWTIHSTGIQPDSVKVSSSENSLTADEKDQKKRTVKIKIVNDTIQEIRVNGKQVDKDDYMHYEKEISRMQEELQASREALEKTEDQLKEAQRELEIAQWYMQADEENDMPAIRDLNRDLLGALSQVQINTEHFNNLLENEEFREQMRIAREETRKALEGLKNKQREYWFQYQDEFREQMKKAQEEARRAFEEFRRNRENIFRDREFWVEPFPEIQELPEVPEVPAPELPPLLDETFPELPAIPDVPDILDDPDTSSPDSPDVNNNSQSQKLNSKLRELEEGSHIVVN